MSENTILNFVFVLIVTAFAQENTQTLKETDIRNYKTIPEDDTQSVVIAKRRSFRRGNTH